MGREESQMVISSHTPRLRNFINRGVTAFFAVTALLLFTSCFTGIESTEKVKLSRQDKKITAPGPEEILNARFTPDTLKDWKEGRGFLVADRRGAVLFRAVDNVGAEMGDTLAFEEIKTYPSPSGEQIAWLVFTDGSNRWEFDTNRPIGIAVKEITSLDLPMLIDKDYVGKVNHQLKGGQFYVRTSEWYGENGERKKGKKYYPVKILEVTPGDNRFPFRVEFEAEGEGGNFVFMSTGQRTTDSRSFPMLFLIEDIRSKYRHISDSTWELIQNGEVRTGMTKEECRLSLGSPANVREGRDYSKLIDSWSYGDGKYLRFEDGLLVEFKQ